MPSELGFRASKRLRTVILSEHKHACQEPSPDGGSRSSAARRPSASGRAAHAAKIAALAEYLPPTDRSLVRWVYHDGKSLAEIACLLRVRRTSLARRVRRLVARCRSPEFAFVAAHMSTWPAPMAHVARACVLEGRSVRSAAGSLRTTVHAARSLRAEVLAMSRGVQQARDGGIREWRK